MDAPTATVVLMVQDNHRLIPIARTAATSAVQVVARAVLDELREKQRDVENPVMVELYALDEARICNTLRTLGINVGPEGEVVA
jgi:hypothetical protein